MSVFGTEFQFYMMKRTPEVDSDGCMAKLTQLMALKRTLKMSKMVNFMSVLFCHSENKMHSLGSVCTVS